MTDEISKLETQLEQTLADAQQALTDRVKHANAGDMVNLTLAIRNITDSWCRMESIKIQREQIRRMLDRAGAQQPAIMMIGGAPPGFGGEGAN